jgi:DnaK suppressor protein
MTKTELSTFRVTLENKRAELGPVNREALAVQTTSDEMDRIQLFTEREYATNNLERNSNRLREVRDALARLDEGVFGVCVDCEANINLKRLIAVPWASTCIACQEKAERAAAESGSVMSRSIGEAA